MGSNQRIVITPGEPAGIGPDLVAALAQQAWPVELAIFADPVLLTARTQQLGLLHKGIINGGGLPFSGIPNISPSAAATIASS